MPTIWFTADFHFGHSNIIRYCNPPFQSVKEMDRTILDLLNDSAKANDILYFLGDFCIGSKAKALEYRKQIRCKKIFAVAGNHDKQIRKLTEEFSWLSNLAEISIHGQPIVICHYAMRVGIAPIMERGTCTDILMGTSLTHLPFPWMSASIHMISARGISTKSAPLWLRG
jgi:calcineurin-like phosphoesterase family protein